MFQDQTCLLSLMFCSEILHLVSLGVVSLKIRNDAVVVCQHCFVGAKRSRPPYPAFIFFSPCHFRGG